jgi:hypothetical protein
MITHIFETPIFNGISRAGEFNYRQPESLRWIYGAKIEFVAAVLSSADGLSQLLQKKPV